ncbi:MAG: caspase family protein [Chloroflexota bacterium]|nr:caspase family protein [Chloroflexota bacterium]
MATKDDGQVFDQVRTHAFHQLSWSKRQNTNLFLDERTYKQGETIGPKRQGIVAERSSILVFADDEPMANFAHACRYILYDAQTGSLHREVPAQFPPFGKARPKTLKPFHEPVRFFETPNLFKVRPRYLCPVLVPYGNRYAILFSGMSNKRHLNDLEFLYRTLIDRYSFDPDNIYALSYDGTLNTQDGVQSTWPGDSASYRIQLTGEGTRSALEDAIDDLKGKIKRDDLLLIHTNNHGGYDGTPGTANLCTYPDWDGYYANDFANKLAELPKFRKLIVMMEQCHAGGFNSPIIAKSTADDTSVASAATEPNNSYVTSDGNWDPFARDWIAAQAGNDPSGAALAFNPDTDSNGLIEAEEAYAYADAVKDARDTPNYNESSEAGGDIALGQEFTIWWIWWCKIMHPILYKYYLKLPPPEYFAKLKKVQPELARLVTSLERDSAGLRKDYTERVETAVKQAFEKKGR